MNCKVIKKWQLNSYINPPPPPSFSGLFPLSSKKSHTLLVTQFSEGPIPLFNKEGGGGFQLYDYLSSYVELLEKCTSISTKIKRLHTMVYEIFKTPNNLNPVFMKDIFHYSPNVTCKKHNLYIHTQNTTKFGNKSFFYF